MGIKYHCQNPLMVFVYHIVRRSRTEHPNKRAVTELKFDYRIKN